MAIPGKENENGVYEFPYMRPKTTSKWEDFRNVIWNPSTKEILGRSGKSWGQLLVFYTLFYIVLAALFAICMQGLFATIDSKQPTWMLDRSLIGTNPGLGFRPISNRTEEGSLITYDAKNVTSIKKWVALMDDFFKPYTNSEPGDYPNRVPCSIEKPPKAGETCTVDIDGFGPCSRTNSYGYNNGSSPCVFLKLNRIYGWVPDYYNDVNNLPGEMPEDVTNHIKELGTNSTNKAQLNQVWVSCAGEYPADKEGLTQPFRYYPTQGFSGFYYPYANDPGYLSPIVAVEIVHPVVNTLINIECRAWAKNINYRGGNLQREGSVHFELMRDA